jgi:CheY-like chemotaxis protein
MPANDDKFRTPKGSRAPRDGLRAAKPRSAHATKDKRKSARGHVSAVAVLLEGERLLGNHRVLNLSSGGALLVGRAPHGANRQLGVLLRMSTGKVVKANAGIVREESVEDSSVFAIEFTGLGDEDADAINSLVLTAVADEREPTSLVITDTPEVGQLLRRQLAALGHPAFGVSNIDDATRLLEAPNQLTVALVDLALGPTRSGEVLSYLASHRPAIRRIVVGKAARAGSATRSAIRSATTSGGVPPRVAQLAQAVVPRPWTHDDLVQALELEARPASK